MSEEKRSNKYPAVAKKSALFKKGDIMDLISREELIADLLEARREETDTIPKLIRFIEKRPTAEPKTGRWIQKSKPLELCTYWWRECSVCGNKPPNDIYGHPNYLSPYCPNCGARMESE